MKNTITPEEHARIKRRRWRQTLGLLITVLVLIGFITAAGRCGPCGKPV